jgi:preprotein translocase subunit YajC
MSFFQWVMVLISLLTLLVMIPGAVFYLLVVLRMRKRNKAFLTTSAAPPRGELYQDG